MNGVLQSAQYITSIATSVAIDQDGVDRAAEKLLPQLAKPSGGTTPTPQDPLEPPGLSETELLEWRFLLDTLNFCFWSDEMTLFTVRYLDKDWTGYQSLCAALCRAKVMYGLPVHKPSFYGSITSEQLKRIFKSDSHVQMPLLSRRMDNLHEAASVLNKKFGGSVVELIHQSGKSAQKLVRLLVENFASYNDRSVYRGQQVSFFKRAQIFAANVWNRFDGCGFGEFNDIESLTMFADYRVPQSLLYLGVLRYDENLMTQLKEGTHLEAGSEQESEIRGCSIWAVELIKNRMLSMIKDNTRVAHGEEDVCEYSSKELISVKIDYFLWNYAKTHAKDMDSFPIHRTYTIFY